MTLRRALAVGVGLAAIICGCFEYIPLLSGYYQSEAYLNWYVLSIGVLLIWIIGFAMYAIYICVAGNGSRNDASRILLLMVIAVTLIISQYTWDIDREGATARPDTGNVIATGFGMIPLVPPLFAPYLFMVWLFSQRIVLLTMPGDEVNEAV